MSETKASEAAPGPRARVLVAHESPEVGKFFLYTLKDEFDVGAVPQGEKVVASAGAAPVADLVLVSASLADVNGFEVCRRLKAEPKTAGIPLIMLAAQLDAKDEAKAFSLGVLDILLKPYSVQIVLARLRNYVQFRARQRALEKLVLERNGELRDTRAQITRRLALAAEFREGGLTNRVLRVSHYAKLIGEALGASAEICETLFQAAPLYDIGKLGLPESLLRKTDRLTPSEREEMMRHAEIGARIIGEHPDPVLESARVMALTHHERWDGGGYPAGLKGEQIPWPGRIVALADAFDAMTNAQYYRPAMDMASTLRAIAQESGKQFDARVVEAFKKALPKLMEIRKKLGDERKGMHDLDFAAAAPTQAALPPPPPSLRLPRATENTVRIGRGPKKGNPASARK